MNDFMHWSDRCDWSLYFTMTIPFLDILCTITVTFLDIQKKVVNIC